MMSKKKLVIFLILLSIKSFSQTLVKNVDDSWCIEDGSSVIKIKYKIDAAAPFSSFSNDLCSVKILGKWSYINTKGEIVIVTDYDDVNEFRSGVAMVIKNNKVGFINTKGDVIVDLEYDVDKVSFYHHDDNYFFLRKNGFACLLNKNGQEIISEKDNFSFVGFFSQTSENEYFSYFFNDGLCAVKRNEKWGFVNLKGQLIIPCEYDEYRPFFNGISPVSKNGKWGFIDKNNRLLIPFEFDDITNYHSYYGHSSFTEDDLKEYKYFNSGMCPASKKVDGQFVWGFINQNGKIVIPFKYNRVESFNSTGTAVVYDELWELRIIDIRGNNVEQ